MTTNDNIKDTSSKKNYHFDKLAEHTKPSNDKEVPTEFIRQLRRIQFDDSLTVRRGIMLLEVDNDKTGKPQTMVMGHKLQVAHDYLRFIRYLGFAVSQGHIKKLCGLEDYETANKIRNAISEAFAEGIDASFSDSDRNFIENLRSKEWKRKA